jgi:DNA repair protein RadC
LFFFRRCNGHAVFELARVEYAAVRVLAEADRPTAEKADHAWLRRVEIRGSKQVADVLESRGFRERPGMMMGMFVDSRCGLIGTEMIGIPATASPDQMVADILRMASSFHAHGIILATHDPSGALARTWRCRELLTKLHCKGEAIEVFLLDHFVLTGGQWTRMSVFKQPERI